MYTSLEERKKDFRTIYNVFYDDLRIKAHPLWKMLELKHETTARNRLKETLELGYIIGPQIRKKSYANLIEYIYYANCKDPEELFEKLKEDRNVFYHEIMDGFANFRIFSNKEISVERDVIAGGPRSDYFISFALDRSWEVDIGIMLEMVKRFNPKEYNPKGIIENHWNETIKWNETDAILYKEMKYNLRGYLDPTARKHKIFSKTAFEWLDTDSIFVFYSRIY